MELFIAAEQYINLVTLNQICEYTNGNTHFFKKFRLDTHYKSLISRINKILTRNIGLEAVMRTRFSSGYKINGFITPVLVTNGDLMVMSNVDEDQSYTFTLDLADRNVGEPSQNPYGKQEENYLYIQTALLYTHYEGTKRIRVHNLCLPMSKKITDIHESIDADAMIAYLTKLLIDKIYKTKKIVNSVLSIENQLKVLISSIFSATHSLSKDLPAHLEYLPLYFLGLLKNRIACKDEISLKLDIDTSNYIRIKLLKLSTEEISNFLYPKFYQIHHMLVDHSIGTTDDNGSVILPEIISTNSKSMDGDGLYLVDNGFSLFLYVKLEISQTLVKSFFKVDNLSLLKTAVTEDIIFATQNEFTEKLSTIVDYLRSTKSFYQMLLVVFESTESERL